MRSFQVHPAEAPTLAAVDLYTSTGPVLDEARVSQVVAALERVWNEGVRVSHPELPDVAIVVASGAEGLKVKRWGHFAAGRWVVAGGERRSEILIAAELLAHGPIDVLGTLLHEAAHALAFARGLKDTSRQGRYHNERYRALAIEVGLVCERDDVYGWTITRCTDATVEVYEPALQELETAGRFYREDLTTRSPVPPPGEGEGDGDMGAAGGGDAPKKGGRLLLVCRCAAPRKIRASASVAELGPILCGICGEAFDVADG